MRCQSGANLCNSRSTLSYRSRRASVSKCTHRFLVQDIFYTPRDVETDLAPPATRTRACPQTLYVVASGSSAPPGAAPPPKLRPTEGLCFFSEPGFFYLRLEPYGTRPRTSEATLCSRCFLETAGARSPHRGPQPAHSTARVQQPSARPDGPTAADGLSAGSVPAQCRLSACAYYLPSARLTTWSRRRWARRCRAASTRRPRRPPSHRACALRRCLLGGADDVRGCQNATG